ncbi:MAG: TolC family protein [bacterium]|jgi:cobalt-zinc-cadmium efflux system outer membrane protein
MRDKHLLLAITLAVLAIAGCAGRGGGTGFPEPRPLGSELEVYMAPEKPEKQHEAAPRVAEPAGDLTLRQVLGLALMGNPELAGYSWAVRAADARALQASRIPNPGIEVELEQFGGVGEVAGLDGAEATLRLGQVLEIGGKRGKRTQVALLERDLEGWEYEARRLDVFAGAASAFIAVLANQERLIVAQESHRLSEIVLEVVSERVKAGKVSPLEETRAAVEAASTEIEVERVRNDLEASRRALAATWGGGRPGFGEVRGDLTQVEKIPALKDIMSRAGRGPELARWGTEIEMHQAVLDLEKSLRIPDLELGVGVARDVESSLDTYILALGFEIPVFDRNQGGVREAECNLARAREDRRATEIGVAAEMAQAYQSLATSYVEARSLGATVLPGAERAFEATGEGYRQGKFTYLDVLDSQRTLFDVRAQYLDALEAYHQAVTEIERIIGEGLNGEEENNSGGEQ